MGVAMEDAFAPPATVIGGEKFGLPRVWLVAVVRVLQGATALRLVAMPVVFSTGVIIPYLEDTESADLGDLLLALVLVVLALGLLAYILSYLVEVALWWTWSFILTRDVARASRAGLAATREGFPHEPVMAVLWWFVPVASLYWAFQVLSDVWTWMDVSDASDDPSYGPPSVFRAWWAARVASVIVPLAAVCGAAELLGPLYTALIAVLEVASEVLAIVVVGTFHARHTVWLERVRGGPE